MCINYITHPDQAEVNKQLVKEVFKQLQESNVTGVKYAVFKMGETVFVHLAQFEDDEAMAQFHALPAFQNFQKNIADRLVSEPIITPISEIGTITTFNVSPANEAP